MVWGWSHTHEAYVNAEANLREFPREKLEVIFAEWRAAQGKGGVIEDNDAFDQRKYDRALKHAKTLATDVLADFIWEHACGQSLCDNGGYMAWMCPSGCGPHCVPFSANGTDEEDDFDSYFSDADLDDEEDGNE